VTPVTSLATQRRQLAEMVRVNRNALPRFEKNDPGAAVSLAGRLARVLGYAFDICLETRPLPRTTA
jgi:DNA-binding XRE family transcriptional regulator